VIVTINERRIVEMNNKRYTYVDESGNHYFIACIDDKEKIVCLKLMNEAKNAVDVNERLASIKEKCDKYGKDFYELTNILDVNSVKDYEFFMLDNLYSKIR
jgi:hypothetical protein